MVQLAAAVAIRHAFQQLLRSSNVSIVKACTLAVEASNQKEPGATNISKNNNYILCLPITEDFRPSNSGVYGCNTVTVFMLLAGVNCGFNNGKSGWNLQHFFPGRFGC